MPNGTDELLPGKSVEEYNHETHLAFLKSLQSTILHVMNVAPNPDESTAGLYATDIIDAVLAALLEFTDCDMIVECILKEKDLVADLHERMTSNI